jgi:hypothetical protein
MNNDNLKTLSPNEARENGKKGGIKSGQTRRERKALKDELLLLLENGKIQNNICLALIDKAQNGDIKAFEVIRDTIGENPNKIEANIGGLKIVVADEKAKTALEDL